MNFHKMFELVENVEVDMLLKHENVFDWCGGIEINVTFGYEDKDSKVLTNIKLTINAGQTVALVGSSGTGKSTLCSLLPRFYDVEKGDIKIDKLSLLFLKI